MELSRDGGTDARGTIDELWQLRQAHPELDGRIEAGIDSLPTLYREIVRTRLSMLRIKSASSKPMMAAPARWQASRLFGYVAGGLIVLILPRSDVDKEQETMLARIRARQQQKAASSDSAVAGTDPVYLGVRKLADFPNWKRLVCVCCSRCGQGALW